MTREQAVEIAKRSAIEHLPEMGNDPRFTPHEWVIQAILGAALVALESLRQDR